jgi:CheY-like chemotaxis protein
MDVNRPRIGGRVLIASDQRAEAEAVRYQLAQDYPDSFVSFDAGTYVEDFERVRPDVLLLVFNRIENAQSYYLGLYRFGTTAQQHGHRTIVFCGKEQVKKAFELCRRQYFDDYVLFWPAPYDGSRLPMSIHVALRELKQSRGLSLSERQLDDYARQLEGFKSMLDQRLTQGGRQVESATEELARTGRRLASAIERFLERVADGDLDDTVAIQDAQKLEREFHAFVSREIGPLVESGRAAVEPLRTWAGQLQHESIRQLERAQSLLKLVADSARRILVVDDDEFSQKVVSRILERAGYDVVLAGSGTEALNLVRKTRPSLILMDYMLPDQDGVETTRRLRQSESLPVVPIIMLTGQSNRDTVIRSLAAGAVDFLAKPINPGALLNKLGRYLGAD